MVSDVTSRTAPLEHDLGMLHAGLAQRNADLESMVEVHAKSVEDVQLPNLATHGATQLNTMY